MTEAFRERGSVLMLMPAAVLILVILGAIAVDRAVIFGAQRDLVATAEAAANDAAGLGLAVDDLRANGTKHYDPGRINRAVALAADRADGQVTASWELRGSVVVVHLSRRAKLVFSQAIPGSAGVQIVVATATASLISS